MSFYISMTYRKENIEKGEKSKNCPWNIFKVYMPYNLKYLFFCFCKEINIFIQQANFKLIKSDSKNI